MNGIPSVYQIIQMTWKPKKNKPFKRSESSVPKADKSFWKQVMLRVNPVDHKAMKKLLEDDEISFQVFADACFQAYLRGDPSILKVIKDHRLMRELSAEIPKNEIHKYVFSHRERQEAMEKLEKETALAESNK